MVNKLLLQGREAWTEFELPGSLLTERRLSCLPACLTCQSRRHPDTRKLLCDSCGRHVRTHGGLPVLEAQGE